MSRVNTEAIRSSVSVALLGIMLGWAAGHVRMPNLQSPPAVPDPVQYYSFNTAGPTISDAGIPPDEPLTVVNATFADGVSGQALRTAGTGAVSAAPFNTSQDIAISFWYRPRDPPGLSYEYTLLRGRDREWQFVPFWIWGGRPGERLVFERRNRRNRRSIYSQKTNWEAGNWYHIVVQHTDHWWEMWINGQLNRRMNSTFNVPTRNIVMEVGGEQFRGAIDELRIFNRSLSPPVIQQLSQNPR